MTDDFGLPRYRAFCPLCPWTLDTPLEDDDPAATAAGVLEAMDRLGMSRAPLAAGTETLAEVQHRIAFTQLAASLQPSERAARAHLETHDLLEWVAAASKLFTLRQSLGALEDAAPPADERVFAAIYDGGLTVNDGRWIRHAATILDALKQLKGAAAT